MKMRRMAALWLALLILFVQSASAECGHMYEKYTSKANSRYEQATFGWHRHIYNEYSFAICAYCGDVKSEAVSEEEFEEQEKHIFEDGVCYLCGYENPCAHQMGMYEQIIEQPTGEQGWQMIDGLTHGGVGRRIRRLACSTCGEELEREVLEEEIELVERHNFMRGICFDCKYFNQCDHPELLCERWMENPSYEPLDGEKHRVTATISEYAQCGICLENLGRTDRPAETLDTEEAHVFGEKFCFYCGYENPCLHEGEMRSSLHIFNGTYEPKDEEEHFIRGAVYEISECTLCHQVVGTELFEEKGALSGAHVFEEGACRDCGFANACPHELTQQRVYIDSMSDGAQENYGEAERSFERADAYEPVDWLRHIQRGDRRRETFCIDCGEILDDVLLEEDTEEIAEHRLNGEGQCVLCGYACLHEGDTFTYEDWNMLSYEPVDATCHEQRGSCYSVEACSVCSAVLSRRLIARQAEKLAPHSFTDGRCTLCGAAGECGHEQVNVFVYADEAVYTPVDALTHSAEGRLTVSSVCMTCYAALDGQNETLPLRRTENHRFIEGQCMWCGTANECSHELTRRDLYAEDAVYTPVDGLTHRAEGTILAGVSCRECGEMLEIGQDAGQDSLTGQHAFSGGACVMCGYANECAHEETEEVVFFTGASYARLDADSHMAFGTKFLRRSCVLCRETLESTLLAPYAEEAAAHIYEEGVCLHCGEREAR